MDPKIIPPPEYLKNHVRYFWVLENNPDKPQNRNFRTMADGCPGLIFQHPDHGVLFQGNKQLPDTFLFGQSTAYNELSLSGNFNAIGVFFQPHALRSVFGMDAQILTDSCLDLSLLHADKDFSDQLLQAGPVTDKINLLSGYLFYQICKNRHRENPRMQFALSRIIASHGNMPMSLLQQELQLSERTLERKFKEFTGISPKLFSRICRFQASLKLLQSSDYDKLSDIAFEKNYADQSHFIRSFRQFAGFSPFEYKKNSTELVENLSEITK